MGVCAALIIVTAVLVHSVMSSQMTSEGYCTSSVLLGVFQVMASSSSSVEGQSGFISLQEAWMVASCFELIGIGQLGLCWSGSEGFQWMVSVFIVVNVLQAELCMEFAV